MAKRRKKLPVIETLADGFYAAVDDCKTFPSYLSAKLAFENAYASCQLERTRGNVTKAGILANKDRKDLYTLMRRAQVDQTWFRRET